MPNHAKVVEKQVAAKGNKDRNSDGLVFTAKQVQAVIQQTQKGCEEMIDARIEKNLAKYENIIQEQKIAKRRWRDSLQT